MTIFAIALSFIIGLQVGESQNKKLDSLEIKTHKIYIVKKTVE